MIERPMVAAGMLLVLNHDTRQNEILALGSIVRMEPAPRDRGVRLYLAEGARYVDVCGTIDGFWAEYLRLEIKALERTSPERAQQAWRDWEAVTQRQEQEP